MTGLNLDVLPAYVGSSFRYFDPNEKHVTRVCPDDVLLMVFDGALCFSENGRPVRVKKGEYYIQRSGLFQEGVAASEQPKYYYIHFHGQFSTSGKLLPLSGKIQTDEFFGLFQKLEFLKAAKASAIEQNAVFYQILALLLQPLRDSEQHQVFQKAAALFANDLRRHFSLDFLSQSCGYSKNQIINIFKAETGKTPYNYVMGLRREAACQLLLNSELSVSQIAAECGYGNYVNFYKDFVRNKGCAPAIWRQQKRSKIL